jgi:hypothetical protein
VKEDPGALKGDYNSDGIVDFLDLMLILVRIEASYQGDDLLKAADMNNDGIVDFLDMMLILLYIESLQ